MNSLTAIAIAVIVAFIIAREVVLRIPHQQGEDDIFDSIRLQREVDELHRRMQELANLDSMIIDLRLCKPDEIQRAFRMEWQSSSGKNNVFDFFADGENSSTTYLLELAMSEREQLNADIATRIYDLYQRAQTMQYYGEEFPENEER